MTIADRSPEALRRPAPLERAARFSARMLLVGAAIVATIWVIGKIWLVLLPLAIAVLIARALDRPNRWLRRRGLPRLAAAVVSFVGMLALVAVTLALLGMAVADEFRDLGPTIDQALVDVEDWLVDDSPFDIDEQRLRNLKSDLGEAIRGAVGGSSQVVSGAMLAAELVLSVFVGLIVAFYAVKDGDRFAAWVLRRLPPERAERAERAGVRAWATLGGFLRGAATLGVVEGTIIGITVALAGGELAVPLAVITLIAAFVPFLGAIASGVLVVLVTLATAGPGPALIVGIVVVVLQQLDNELLAPVLYGRAVELHPVVIMIGILTGGAVFGIPGTVFAVPATAILVAVIGELYPTWSLRPDGSGGSPPADPTTTQDAADPTPTDGVEPTLPP